MIPSRSSHLVVAALLLAGCGGNGSSSTSTPSSPTGSTAVTNRVPSITNVTLSPAFAVSGVTVISMSASATDADNDALTYQWSFAGKTMTGATVASTVAGDGAVTVELTVSDGKGGTTRDNRTVTVGSMSGRWTFVFTGTCNPTVPTVLPILALTQTENLVTGDLSSTAAWCNVPAGQSGKLDPAAPAKIDGDGNFTGARLKIGSYQDTFLTGKMDSTGRTITGTTRANLGSTSTFRMVKQ